MNELTDDTHNNKNNIEPLSTGPQLSESQIPQLRKIRDEENSEYVSYKIIPFCLLIKCCKS